MIYRKPVAAPKHDGCVSSDSAYHGRSGTNTSQLHSAILWRGGWKEIDSGLKRREESDGECTVAGLKKVEASA